MPTSPAETRLEPYARLPRSHHDRTVLHSTVDAEGRAHWRLGEHRPRGAAREPYDAVVVTVGDGPPHETHLSALTARFPHLAALPDGGVLVAEGRSREGDEQVRVFDAPGRPSWAFRVGDAIEHLLTDAAGGLWVGYHDEGVYGDDPRSAPGPRHWSSTGGSVWPYQPVDGADWMRPVTEGRLLGPGGGPLDRRRLVCRGPRLCVQEPTGSEWTVLDIG